MVSIRMDSSKRAKNDDIKIMSGVIVSRMPPSNMGM